MKFSVSNLELPILEFLLLGMNDIFSRALKIALRTGDKVIVIDPSQPKPYIMLDLEDYENLLEAKVSGLSAEAENPQKQVLTETVKVNLGTRKRKNLFEAKISEMALPTQKHEISEDAEMGEAVALLTQKHEMETEERFFFEPNA